jgi:hypothetical protein
MQIKIESDNDNSNKLDFDDFSPDSSIEVEVPSEEGEEA